jgi:serine/threonine protein phosphatase PrpC
MSGDIENLRRLFSGRGETLDPNRDALFVEFGREGTTVEALSHISGWEAKIMSDWRDKTVRADLVAVPVTLANAMVGRDYVGEVRLGAMDHLLGDHRCHLDGVPGLSYDPTTRLISGKPTDAGEFDIVLDFRPIGAGADSLWSRRVIRFIVNHDPKSLWKDEPSNREDPYWQPDEAVGSAEICGHLVLVASKRGRSHAHEGKFRDDAFRVNFFNETGWGIIAVSDGAGASKYSRKGSVLACDAVVDFFQALPSEQWNALDDAVADYLNGASEPASRQVSAVLTDVLGRAALDAQHSIRKESTDRAVEMKDYSCTLIFALCRQFPTHFVVASFWVGDGGIGIYHETSETAHLLGEPDSGEYAGQTRFLTMPDIFAGGAYAQRIRFKAVERFSALVLMTDGITDPKFQTDANLKNPVIWKELWGEIAGFGETDASNEAPDEIDSRKRALLQWLDFWSPGNHDDRTIAVLYGAP